MWVQLRTTKHIEVHGKPTKFSPGDWVDVGKQLAMLWIQSGDACIPGELPAALNGAGSGALVLSGHGHAAQALSPYIGLAVERGDYPELRWARTIVWDATAAPGVQPGRFGAGLALLDTWEIAVPLVDYKTLAANLGSEEEREQTKKVIIDLRVPVYDTRLMFARKTPDTERLFAVWRDEPGERRLAFLRSLWAVKPLLLALPCHWCEGGYAN